MAGFEDLIPQAQPCMADGGTRGAAFADGGDWYRKFTDFTDLAGDPIDLTPGAGGVTGTCVIYDKTTRDPLITLDYDGGVGWCSIAKAAASTGGLSNDEEFGRECVWSFKLVKDYALDPDQVVWVWLPDTALVTIKRSVG